MKRLEIKIKKNGINSTTNFFDNLKLGLTIPNTYHLNKGPVKSRVANPVKINTGSKSSPKFIITDFPILKAIKIKINPNKRLVAVFFFLKKHK
jgi:hypothetical protein